VDGLTPDCQTATGCAIPPLEPESQRIMHLRGLILRLAGLVDAGTILTLAGADLDDLVLLACTEDLLKTQAPTP
jgi:hypothetical protein